MSRVVIMKALTIFTSLLVFKAGKPVGTVSERKDGKYKKTAPGVWERVTEEIKGKKENNKEIIDKYQVSLIDEEKANNLYKKGLETNSNPKIWEELGDIDPDSLSHAYLMAGAKKRPKPFLSVGWRYGEAQGRSWNKRENKKEAGTSLAQLKGFKKTQSFAAQGEENKKHFYIGYVITHDLGADDEFLFVPGGKYAPIEISKEDYDNYEPQIPDLEGWWVENNKE